MTPINEKLEKHAVAELLRRLDRIEQRLTLLESKEADPEVRREMRQLSAHLAAYLLMHSKSPPS